MRKSGDMQVTLRPAQDSEMLFAFEIKRQALGPYVEAKWGWNEDDQLSLHQQKWSEKPWFIVQLANTKVGTVSIQEHPDFIRFGEFYLLPEYQGKGLGSQILSCVLEDADRDCLPVKLEYLKWNPVGSLYRRHGFRIISESHIHYFAERKPTFTTA